MRGVVYAHPARRLSQLALRLNMHSVFRGCHISCSHDSKRFCLGQILAHDCYWEVELALWEEENLQRESAQAKRRRQLTRYCISDCVEGLLPILCNGYGYDYEHSSHR
ncbi:hypothetical protein HMPREF0620_1306 [Parascardovia denticolens DSM 10105 = JCM 12538]|uniref:Uncharacterized protein n=1 Tax=Parascardovia denticolens DSM 10105 = JCM 12538 TaxID=864564 RepID=E6K2R7_PARDN|nr:hypothetical protein HMPREF0620_1306 [Parascardovia denticolens DSM 10105 = JCM 12538]